MLRELPRKRASAGGLNGADAQHSCPAVTPLRSSCFSSWQIYWKELVPSEPIKHARVKLVPLSARVHVCVCVCVLKKRYFFFFLFFPFK